MERAGTPKTSTHGRPNLVWLRLLAVGDGQGAEWCVRVLGERGGWKHEGRAQAKRLVPRLCAPGVRPDAVGSVQWPANGAVPDPKLVLLRWEWALNDLCESGHPMTCAMGVGPKRPLRWD